MRVTCARHMHARHDRAAGEQCQQVTPLEVASGGRGVLQYSSMASCSTWQGGRGMMALLEIDAMRFLSTPMPRLR